MEPLQILPPGTVVYGADGEPIGTVASADEQFAVVGTGDYPPFLYVPVGAIFETREDGAYLSVTGEDARNRGWGREPELEELPLAAAEVGVPYSTALAGDSADGSDTDPSSPTTTGTGASRTGNRSAPDATESE